MKDLKNGCSIDGGGILGIGSARLLMELEKEIGKPIQEIFDFFAGTSTGAILAALYAKGYSAQRVYEIFSIEGAEVFKKAPLTWRLNPFRPKYQNKNLKRLLFKYLTHKKFDELEKPLFVCASDLYKGEQVVFSRKNNKLVRDAVLMSSAAPTYFEPIENRFVDGGLWANNPAIVGAVGAANYYKVDLKDISMFSLGTGGDLEPRCKPKKSWSALNWAKPLIEFSLLGNESGTEFLIKRLGLGSYYRIEPKLEKGFELDDVGKMFDYSEIWRKLFKKEKELLKHFFRVL